MSDELIVYNFFPDPSRLKKKLLSNANLVVEFDDKDPSAADISMTTEISRCPTDLGSAGTNYFEIDACRQSGALEFQVFPDGYRGGAKLHTSLST